MTTGDEEDELVADPGIATGKIMRGDPRKCVGIGGDTARLLAAGYGSYRSSSVNHPTGSKHSERRSCKEWNAHACVSSTARHLRSKGECVSTTRVRNLMPRLENRRRIPANGSIYACVLKRKQSADRIDIHV